MKEDIEFFDEKAFLNEFIKKLNSFLMKAPIQAKAKIIRSKVEIKVAGINSQFNYNLDYDLDVKENINNIKNILYEKAYPTIEIITKEEVPFSSKEIEEMVASGISLAKALIMKKEIKNIEKFKIKRVIMQKDQLFLKNTNGESKEYLYKLKMPLSIFLKRQREQWSMEETSKAFEKNAEFIKIIYPSDVWKKMNEEKHKTEAATNVKEKMDIK